MQIIRAHTTAIDAVAFAPDGRAIASAGGFAVRLHSLQSGEQLREWPGSILWTTLAFHPDGTRLIQGGVHADGLHIHSLREGGPDIYVEGRFNALAVSPDGRVVATATDEVLRVSVDTGRELPGGWGGTRVSTKGERFPAGGIAYAPDGRLLAAVFGVRGKDVYNSHVLFWDAESGQLVGELVAPFSHDHPHQIAFSPNGTILTGIGGPVLRAWDAHSYQELAVRKTGKKHFKAMAFSPDGRWLITVSNDKTARVWNCSTWREVGGYEWKIGKLRAVAVAPDGLRVAAGGDSGKIVVWDFED